MTNAKVEAMREVADAMFRPEFEKIDTLTKSIRKMIGAKRPDARQSARLN